MCGCTTIKEIEAMKLRESQGGHGEGWRRKRKKEINSLYFNFKINKQIDRTP